MTASRSPRGPSNSPWTGRGTERGSRRGAPPRRAAPPPSSSGAGRSPPNQCGKGARGRGRRCCHRGCCHPRRLPTRARAGSRTQTGRSKRECPHPGSRSRPSFTRNVQSPPPPSACAVGPAPREAPPGRRRVMPGGRGSRSPAPHPAARQGPRPALPGLLGHLNLAGDPV